MSPPLSENEGEGDASLRATYAGAKRRIVTLESQLKALQEAGTKRKSDIVTHITQGRVITRLVSMFEHAEVLVEENDRRRALDLAEAEEDSELGLELPTIEQGRIHRGYELLVQHVSCVEQKLLEYDATQLCIYFRDLRKGAGGARGDDAANLKPSVVSWIATLFDPTHNYAPLSPIHKSERGFEHEISGRLLCPIDYNWDDMGVQQKIREGHPDYIVTGDSWPAFLFPNGKADPTDFEKGLFRSALLLKTYKFLFTSPTSAQDIDSEKDLEDPAPRTFKRKRGNRVPTRGHVANLMGMKSVTPRSIAYVAVQLRFSLSNASAWQEDDGLFNYAHFYNNVIDYFELTPGPAALKQSKELLSWWSSKIFGKHTTPVPAGSQPNSSVAKLAAQRAARERRI